MEDIPELPDDISQEGSPEGALPAQSLADKVSQLPQLPLAHGALLGFIRTDEMPAQLEIDSGPLTQHGTCKYILSEQKAIFFIDLCYSQFLLLLISVQNFKVVA